MDIKLLDGFPKTFIDGLQKKYPVPGKKDFVYLATTKKTAGYIGKMTNPEARKIFKHATDNIN